MSLIVARKHENQLAVVSDTKLTYPSHEVKGTKANPIDGVLKTIIINSEVCISFAGEVEAAESTIAKIHSATDLPEIIGLLLKSHNAANYNTEFQLCVAFLKPRIYEIKAGRIDEVHSSWIGSQEAFNRFQAYMIGVSPTEPSQNSTAHSTEAVGGEGIFFEQMNISIDSVTVPLFLKMSAAMDSVIEDENINTVGGFKVLVTYEDKFLYKPYLKAYRANFSISSVGEHIISPHGSAGEGGYTVNFFCNSEDYQSIALHLLQGKFGILYHRRSNGLLRPEIIKGDEVDFIDSIGDRYKVFPALITQDRAKKFLDDGVSAVRRNDLLLAKDCFDKAIANAIGPMKARALFYKGVILFNFRDHTAGMQLFQEAILIDSNYQPKIMKFLQDERHRYYSNNS